MGYREAVHESGANQASESDFSALVIGWLDDCPVHVDEASRRGILAMVKAAIGDATGSTPVADEPRT
jgi:hypothetical protein